MAGRTGRAVAAVLLGAGVVAALVPGAAVERGTVTAVRAAAGEAEAWLARQPVTGVATVSDGDTLRVGGVKVRLYGIDAPERSQSCGRGTAGWACGAAAAARLAALAAAGPVSCLPRDTDRYGRTVAVCTAAGVDLGAALVADGLARAYLRYGAEYAETEATAKAERIGLWRGEAEAPWDYRADRARAEAAGPPEPAETPDGGGDRACRIKGNVSAAGRRIYHLPGMAAYARTRIDTRRGEAWFCDEAAARAAGFRPPGR